MPVQHIELNAPRFEVCPKAEEPLRMTQAFGTFTTGSGEKIEFLTAFGTPAIIVLRGEKLVGTIDVSAVVQEALLHVLRENAK